MALFCRGGTAVVWSAPLGSDEGRADGWRCAACFVVDRAPAGTPGRERRPCHRAHPGTHGGDARTFARPVAVRSCVGARAPSVRAGDSGRLSRPRCTHHDRWAASGLHPLGRSAGGPGNASRDPRAKPAAASALENRKPAGDRGCEISLRRGASPRWRRSARAARCCSSSSVTLRGGLRRGER